MDIIIDLKSMPVPCDDTFPTKAVPCKRMNIQTEYADVDHTQAYSAVQTRIVNMAREIMKEDGSAEPWKLYVTGHSLGGALAVLCAYELKVHCPLPDRSVAIAHMNSCGPSKPQCWGLPCRGFRDHLAQCFPYGMIAIGELKTWVSLAGAAGAKVQFSCVRHTVVQR